MTKENQLSGYIVGHVSPDWDCITAIWLLKRYGGMADHEVRFVNTGSPDPALLAAADAVVDTGREYDAARLRFDHHHLPGQAANETCAAFQVFQHVAPNGELNYLAPLNALILQGDTGGRLYGAEWSRLTGIHALLSAAKARGLDDFALLAYGFDILDALASQLKTRYAARATLAQHTFYRSDDGLFVALRNAPQHATFAAFESGARLVLFVNEDEHAIGLMRAGEWQEPHCGGLVELLIVDSQVTADMIDETNTWFLHPGGFFAGRGTKKAPREDPIGCDPVMLALAFDRGWQR